MGKKLYKPTSEASRKLESAYTEYDKQLYSYAYEMTQNKYDAEDAIQTTFEKLAHNLNKIDDVHSNRSFNYIYTILQNTIRDMFRKQSRCPEEAMDIDEMHFPTPQEIDAVENIVISNLKFEDVLECLYNMDEKYKRPFTLRYFKDYSIDEIALATNQSNATASMQIFRAKQKIKECIDGKEWD